jgi:hypothetical protein
MTKAVPIRHYDVFRRECLGTRPAREEVEFRDLMYRDRNASAGMNAGRTSLTLTFTTSKRTSSRYK